MGAFASLGLSSLEEDVYALLVEHPASTAAAVATRLTTGGDRVTAALQTLVGQGLVTESHGSPAEFTPLLPSSAVNVLVLERQRQLEAARLRARQLDERLHQSLRQLSSGPDVAEIVTGRSECTERLRRMHLAAREERLVFTKPPFIDDPAASAGESVSLVARGVRTRCVYDPEALATPELVDHVRDCIRGGEESRVGRVPVKMDVVDGSIAVLPVTGVEEPVYQVLLIRAAPVVAAVTALFELCWEIAAPLRLGAEDNLDATDTGSPLTGDDRDVLSLLSAGQKDDTIARSLGIADRTVGRRVARLMSMAGVQTRFQLAEAAVRRGWMD